MIMRISLYLVLEVLGSGLCPKLEFAQILTFIQGNSHSIMMKSRLKNLRGIHETCLKYLKIAYGINLESILILVYILVLVFVAFFERGCSQGWL